MKTTNLLIFHIMTSALVKFRTTLWKIMQSKVLIKLTTVPASDANIALFGEKPVEGVTGTTASSGHHI